MSIPKTKRPKTTGGPAPAESRSGGRGHYFDAAPEVASHPHTVPFRLGEATLELQSDRGVFGSRRVDLGTRILLHESPPAPAEGDVLDLGAGYGPIAIALALSSPGARIWAVDVNERAIELARANAAAAGAANITACLPDDVPAGARFAAIYSNPPVRIGKAALRALLERWLARLAPGGHAYLVVQRNLGSESLAAWLAEAGYPVAKLKSKKGYRVVEVGPRAAPAPA
jgi:16S rRNA (guanine1207-N2)-methyltransferase